MANYDPEATAKLKHIGSLASAISNTINTLDGKKFGDADIKDGKLNFYANVGDSTAIKSIDLPAELFLDQVHTTFVGNFNFAGGGYTNATNPNLDGKPVLVIAVKDNAASPTVTYSFLNMEALVDTYAPLNNGISISGYSIGARISATAGNLLSIAADGLLVGHDDSKVDTVAGAAGNIVVFGADGAIADSGSKFATDAEVAELINQYFPTVQGGNG